MPIERLAESLPFVNWTVLTTLAAGTFAAVVAGRFRTEATSGYLAFTAFSAALFAGLAALSDGGLPRVPASGPGDARFLESARFMGLVALALIAVAYGVALRRGHRAAPLALAGLAASLTTLWAAAAFWAFATPSLAIGSALLLVQLVALSAALGGVWAAMVLGHWYLVTPRLPEAPLVRFAKWLALVLLAQIGLFMIWTGIGAGSSGQPGFTALFELPWGFFMWLRLVVGLVFPLIVAWGAFETAKSRSMESATGLLYINVGTIAAGTILAAGLYFGGGILV